MVDVARGRGRADFEQIARVVGRVVLLVVTARGRLGVVAGRDALQGDRHLRNAVRGQVARRAVHPAGDAHLPLAGDLHRFARRELDAAPALKQRALLHCPRAGHGQHAGGKGRLPPLQTAAREDVAVEVAAREVLRVERRAHRRDFLVRALHAQRCGRQQVVGRVADRFLVAVRHPVQQGLQNVTGRHRPSPPCPLRCASAR